MVITMVTQNIIEKVNLALPYLVHYAQKQKTVTYKGLGEKIDCLPIGMGRMLGYIRDEFCSKKGLPMLNVIVVNSKTGLPGDNFVQGNTSYLDKIEKFREFRDEVFRYAKWDELLKELDLTPI